MAEDGVNQTRGGAFAGAFDEFDAFGDGGAGGYAGQVEKLVEADAETDADFGVEADFGYAEGDEVIELSLIAEGSEDDLGGESGIAGIEGGGDGAEEVGGPGSGLDPKENIESGAAGGGDGGHWEVRGGECGWRSNFYNRKLDIEKTLLRKVGEAIGRFRMIRDGDRVAVALSGGKDSLTLLKALLLLRKKAPVDFSVCAFTVEQGKFLRPIQPLGAWLLEQGIAWKYFEDSSSLRLLEEKPDHGCDLCSRFRRRAVYEIARGLGANVIAFGHTADDFCESFLRNALFTGRLSALPAVTYSSEKDFRLIRPLVFVTEDITRRYAESLGAPVIPCGCSQRTGTVRRSLRDFFTELERDHPHLKENMLSAMGNIQPGRLLDTRYLDLESNTEGTEGSALFPIVTEL
ncbi:MAG: tRNA 2-thiocytidine biosynthesis protein TtcA [Bryobacteraceae bacterium]|nr:tRNA 2-thiocytidine biosynthesis protein TtcA [Bryobacteraceae bacterium]